MSNQALNQSDTGSESAAAKLVDDIVSESEAERDINDLLMMTQQNDLFDMMVEQMKKSGAKVTVNKSTDFLQWRHGGYRLRVDGARTFYWDANGEERSCPILECTVLDGTTKAAKEYVGKSVMVSVFYGLGAAILEHLGLPVKGATLSIRAMFKEPTQADSIAARVQTVACFVECDKDGVPRMKNIKGGHRMLSNARVAVQA